MLVNKYLSNRKLVTPYGEIRFDSKGECGTLTKEQEKALARLPNFEIKAEPKKTEPKKPPTKKATATKKATTTKKE